MRKQARSAQLKVRIRYRMYAQMQNIAHAHCHFSLLRQLQNVITYKFEARIKENMGIVLVQKQDGMVCFYFQKRSNTINKKGSDAK
jgi:hypothetical protein